MTNGRRLLALLIISLLQIGLPATAAEPSRPALHPEVASFLAELAEQDAPGWEEMTPQEGRQAFSQLTHLFGERPEVAACRDLMAGDIPIRVYWPSGDGPFPAVIYFHGGGWVLGDLDTHDALCRRLTNGAQVAVVAVGYRLAPETQFPGPLEDCYEACEYVVERAGELRIDPDRLVVAGDSAGGNLAAGVAILARDRGGPRFRLQVLLYPALDSRCHSPSYDQFASGYALTASEMKWFWRQYLGDNAPTSNSLHSPAILRDLEGLPPAHIVTAECDVLRDEGEHYARRLKAAGVPAVHRRYAGMIHGFIHFCGLFEVGRNAVGEVARVIQTACAQDERAPSVDTKAVSVSEKTIHGDMECFHIVTPSATYLFGKKGAGFASILDPEGNDWISYRPGLKAKGEYRGLPKCGQPTKYFHCGYGYGGYQTDNPFDSRVTAEAKHHVRIESTTLDGKSSCRWDFYPDHATFTLLKIAQAQHWFLYEGTPGGRFDADGDFVIRPSGEKTRLNEYWSEVVPWVLFGAVETPAGFLCINHQQPEPGQSDSYVAWPFEREADGSYRDMTVFGFGRKGYRELTEHVADLRGLPARYTIALIENADFESANKTYSRLRKLLPGGSR